MTVRVIIIHQKTEKVNQMPAILFIIFLVVIVVYQYNLAIILGVEGLTFGVFGATIKCNWYLAFIVKAQN